MICGGYSELAEQLPPHEYQQFAAEWTLDRLFTHERLGAGLFLDPGLGKTRITMMVLNALFDLREIKRVLILAPLRPCYTVWPLEIKKWGFPQANIILHEQHARAMSYNLPVEVCNYEGLVKLQNIKNRWDMVVSDESTFLKTWSTQRNKCLHKMLKTIPKRLLLTGTPAANSLADLHAQMFVIDNGESLGKTCEQFRMRFCTATGYYGREWRVRKSKQDDVLAAIKDDVLRMQAEDYLDMPELVHNDIWVRLPPDKMSQYKRLKRELVAELETGEVYAASASAAYGKCRQFANGQVYSQTDEMADRITHAVHEEKYKALCELHEELAGKPLLIFYWHKNEMERAKAMRGSPFKNCPVIGGREDEKRLTEQQTQKVIEEWNQGKHHAIFAQWSAVAHGNNMQEGGLDIACLDIPDQPELYTQGYRRIYRQGVKGRQVRIHRILAMGTVDEVRVERLSGKFETERQFLQALKEHAKR